MSSFPCVSNFPTPYDIAPAHAHCNGQFNVALGGVEWTVDFDYSEPIIYVGTADVTDFLKLSTREQIIEKAISLHDEECA